MIEVDGVHEFPREQKEAPAAGTQFMFKGIRLVVKNVPVNSCKGCAIFALEGIDWNCGMYLPYYCDRRIFVLATPQDEVTVKLLGTKA